MKNFCKWTPKNLKKLEQLYQLHTANEISEIMQLTKSVIKNALYRFQIKTTRPNSGQFKKGSVPANKGKFGYSAPGCEKGWFKKGTIPPNHKPVGSLHLHEDGYWYVKVAEHKKWEILQRYIYSQHFNDLQKSDLVIFKNKDRNDFRIENLEKITKAQNAARNYNTEKASKCMRELHDNYVAGIMARGSREILEELKKCPELIELKRKQLLLNREIKKHGKEQNDRCNDR